MTSEVQNESIREATELTLVGADEGLAQAETGRLKRKRQNLWHKFSQRPALGQTLTTEMAGNM